VLKKASRNKDADDIPDVRADEPERAMEQSPMVCGAY